MNHHETKEARALVDYLLMAGCMLSVHDGEERTLRGSMRADDVMAALGTVEDDRLIAHDPATGEHRGTFWLIYGNGPGELIADHSDGPFAEAAWRHVQRIV